MNSEDIEARVSRINLTLSTLQAAWPYLSAEITAQIGVQTQSLVAQNDEQTRGRIKALSDLLNLPDTLNQEREGLTAALSEQSDAAS